MSDAPRHSVVLRRASLLDIPGIVQAYHDSVTAICASDYTREQIQAWTAHLARPNALDKWSEKITAEQVWVVEIDGRIEGFAHLRSPLDLAPSAYLNGMYLTPTAKGKGLGRRLMNLVELEARRRGHPRLDLHATKTATGFYTALGYESAGPMLNVQMSDQSIECQPMGKHLAPL